MTRWLGFFELSLMAALVFGVAAVVAVALLWPLLQDRMKAWHPERAEQVTLLLATAPAWLPLLGLALCLVPGLLGGAGLGQDHCPLHGEHAHLCLLHPAVTQGGRAAAALATGCVAATLLLLGGGVRLARAQRALAALLPGRPLELAGGARLLPSPAPVSLTVGVLRPRVIVSQGLVDALPAAGLACVLAHERAHARRRDALRALLAHAFSWPHLPGLRRAFLAAHQLAAERSCDEAAARQLGDRLLAAETILRVERLARARSRVNALACAFGACDVAPRVEALLAEPAPSPRQRATAATLVALAALGLAAAEPLHHAVEHLLRALLTLP